MAQVVKKQASYEDLSHLPDNVLGEIVDVELILTPRPSRKHVVATTVLGAEILPPYQFGRGGGPSGWMTLYEKGGHFMRSMNCLAVVAILFLVLAGNLFAFKAPDESRFPVKSVGVSESVPGLQDITVEDINRVVSGDVVQAAKEVLDDIMKTRFEQAASDQKGASGTGSALPPFTAEVRKVETDSLGFTHIRMAQLVQGLPVVGGEMIVHIDNRNVVYYINGKHLPPVAISIEPSISSETVLQAAIEEFAGVPEVEVGKQPSLVVYGSHLAYHFVILQKGGFAGQWWHYVDAHTGELLLRYNNIQFLMAPPTPGKGKHTKVSGNRLTGEGGSVVKMKGWKEKGGNFYLYNS